MAYYTFGLQMDFLSSSMGARVQGRRSRCSRSSAGALESSYDSAYSPTPFGEPEELKDQAFINLSGCYSFWIHLHLCIPCIFSLMGLFSRQNNCLL
ncbi:uncharacterized protein K460DRAFT_101613 [Cucurbitaria berberidis CBS 394.84]|uniref:Uncharacterized protein n=1 Tax=Cucurbitaria berberidis CBS 394.84 TaxID=1168544 RepID=A0A9P4GGH4_9PLEO|nr:uncharacterized protein K460DRAFT_101613 [Cucurbitaria berberidis CBS 394.84]KAF1845009.1 hypothetical protein K460DRAFT_101613 [Cucurbitaria berberidis CBS 394.84]